MCLGRTIQCSGEDPLIAQNMGATFIISRSGITVLSGLCTILNKRDLGNGSGKTVLLKCICGLLQVSEGTIIVQDKVVGKEVDFPENIGFIIKTPGFLPLAE